MIWTVSYFVLHVAVAIRVLSVDGKEPSSRAAWIVVLFFLPFLGIVAYLLVGEPWVTKRLRGRALEVFRSLNAGARPLQQALDPEIPERFSSGFRLSEKLAGNAVTSGNQARLMADSAATIETMVRDFDAAEQTIHIVFYIWLTDNSGLKVVEALKRAASRGVTCRVIADSMGSHGLIHSPHWRAMREAGVNLCASLPPLSGGGLFKGTRIDLRNHRKIVVIDNCITYCGSQNCADAAFLPKAKFAPWVDIMLRLEGPIAAQNEILFASNWGVEMHANLTLQQAMPAFEDGFSAIAFGTIPGLPPGTSSAIFTSLLFAAQHEVVITTPYFVPDQSLLAAIVACARRGVSTTLILPKRNDSFIVGAISKAQYRRLIQAGVHIFEYRPGLLHAKTMVIDGEIAIVGTTNMDRRSLDLNLENNLLLHSCDVAGRVLERQKTWLVDADAVDPQEVLQRSFWRRIGDNLASIAAPLM